MFKIQKRRYLENITERKLSLEKYNNQKEAKSTYLRVIVNIKNSKDPKKNMNNLSNILHICIVLILNKERTRQTNLSLFHL